VVALSPFVGLRPDDDVAARTLDGALRSAERAARRSRHPRSVAWLESWEDEPVASAEDWVADGSLVVDRAPSLRVIEQVAIDGTRTRGLLGVVALRELVPHERTDAAAVARRAARDRLQGIESRPLLTVLATDPPDLAELIAAVTAGDPELDITDESGARHRVWRCDETTAARISDAVAPVPCLLADGHHRAAAARVLGRTTALALVTLASSPPRLLPIWRIAAIPRGQDTAIAAWVEDLPPGDATSVHVAGRSKRVAARPHELAVVASQRIAEAVPSVARITTTASPATAAVAQRDGAVLVAADPPTVPEVLEAVAGGTPLPPKSTAFSPKPRVGLVLRRVGDQLTPPGP
jgi:hypothetical protein